MALRERQWRYLAGLWAEQIAGAYFFVCGYRIIARRYRCPVGEIDLILRRGKTVAFVEVKYRQSFELAAISLTQNQKLRIVRAAKFWLARNVEKNPGQNFDVIRFDMMLMAPFAWPRHLQNVFDESGY